MNASVPRRLQGLRHDVDLECRRFPEMVAFYRDRLGLPVITQWQGVARLDGGQGRWLTLWRADPAREWAAPCAGRHSGVCFAVDDLERLHLSLRAAGVTFASAPCRQPWGAVMVNLIDPEERLVTLVQHRAAEREWPASRADDWPAGETPFELLASAR